MENMYEFLYIEVNVICILVLVNIILKIKTSLDQQTENLAFLNLVYMVVIILFLDTMWVIAEKRPPAPFWYGVNAFINAAYLSMTGVIGYMTFVYVGCKIHGRMRFGKLANVCLLIPVFVLIMLSFSSIWGKFMFYIDEFNVYHRGPMFFIQPLVSYTYFILSAIHVFSYYFKPEYREKRQTLRLLTVLTVMPCIGGVINLIFYGLPTIWPMATFALFSMFINFQSYQISTDGLTGLNNRRQLDKHLKSVTDDVHRDDYYALMMMDIDDFKHINDTFGHLAGDEALKTTAQILQKICKTRDTFLARYGGDEFVIILHCVSEETAKNLKIKIKDAFEENNRVSFEEYQLTLSVGYRMFLTSDGESPTLIISDADSALYVEKQIRQKKKYT